MSVAEQVGRKESYLQKEVLGREKDYALMVRQLYQKTSFGFGYSIHRNGAKSMSFVIYIKVSLWLLGTAPRHFWTLFIYMLFVLLHIDVHSFIVISGDQFQ